MKISYQTADLLGTYCLCFQVAFEKHNCNDNRNIVNHKWVRSLAEKCETRWKKAIIGKPTDEDTNVTYVALLIDISMMK